MTETGDSPMCPFWKGWYSPTLGVVGVEV